MDIDQTIKKINKTANLKVIGIKRVWKTRGSFSLPPLPLKYLI
jgi:hypothetical protein